METRFKFSVGCGPHGRVFTIDEELTEEQAKLIAGRVIEFLKEQIGAHRGKD